MARVYKRKEGDGWYIDYALHGKRVRERVGPSKEEAQIVLSKRLEDIRHGKNPELRRIKPVLFSDHAKEVLAKHYRRMRSYPTAKVQTEAHLLPYFGPKFLMEITPKLVTDYITERADAGMAPRSVNYERAVLSMIMSLAVRWERIWTNPVRSMRWRSPKGRKRYLTYEEADKLIECAPTHLKPIIVTALETGGRRGEVLGLTWKDVDFDRGVAYFGKTKSGKGREVPITPVLRATLAGLSGSTVRSISGRVFTFRGKPIKNVRTAFEKARTDAKLGKDVVFHTTRHTFASWYVMAGGDLYRLQKLMGHSSITTTMRYAHLAPEHVQGAVSLMGRQGWHKDGTEAPTAGHAGSGSRL